MNRQENVIHDEEKEKNSSRTTNDPDVEMIR